MTEREAKLKAALTPWYELPEKFRRAEIEDLLEEWPEMSLADREYVMRMRPEKVREAGLWPGREAAGLKSTPAEERPESLWDSDEARNGFVGTVDMARFMSLAFPKEEPNERGSATEAPPLSPKNDRPGDEQFPLIRPTKEWRELPESTRNSLVRSLRIDWPTMSHSIRLHEMQNSPDKVKEAGLWPEGGVLVPDPPPRPQPLPRTWEEMPEAAKEKRIQLLREEWPTLKRKERELIMSRSPQLVKAAGLWPELR